MRTLLGWIVLIGGVGALGLWGRADHAKRIEDGIRKAEAVQAPKSSQGATATVSGRDITIRGWVNSTAERQALLGDLDAVEGRRVVIDELKVLPTAKPYKFTGRKAGDAVGFEGNVPSAHKDAGYEAALGITEASLKPALGMPDDNWLSMVGKSISALKLVNEGEFELSDRSLALTGEVDNPAGKAAVEQALSGLPDGYTADLNLKVLDDGTPASIAIAYDASTGAKASGKAPGGMAPDGLAKILGVPNLASQAKSSKQPGGEAMSAALAKIGPWLPFFETFNATVDAGGGVTLDGTLGKGADRELIEKRLGEQLGEGTKVTLSDAPSAGTEGAERSNAATGQKQILRGGYWLPVREFAISKDACAASTDEILKGAGINFVTGSDRLGPRAVRVINNLAATLNHCMTDPSLSVEIGGHTDSQGDDGANLELSNRRAAAVVKALTDRGVPDWSMQAKGYGETSPIADNETAEGRAQNRRTTFTWSQN